MRTIISVSAILSVLLSAVQPAEGQDYPGYGGTDPEGTVAYSLPMTTLTFEVEAVQESFYAGPYAKYASKYLGIEVRQKNAVSYSLDNIRMVPYAEPDLSRRYLIDLAGCDARATFLALTSSGLVSSAESVAGRDQNWRFPVVENGDYSSAALTPNLTTEATTLYKSVKGGERFDKVAVRQDMLVQKTEEMKAAEIASLIFSLRDQRVKIITGDTDASYGGEAMGAALAEIDRLEKEYLTLFTGYSEYGTQTMSFEVIPDKENNIYIAFRISDTAGLLPAENLSGKPVILEITPGNVEEPQPPEKKVKKSKVPVIVYRIPAICNVKLTDGVNVLMQGRVPVYQFGKESTLPVNVSLK